MLKLIHLIEDYDLAKTALRNWVHDDGDIDETLSWFRISSNAIYPFRRNGKLCFLRLAPCDEKLESNIKGELEFIRYLLDNGYPALRPIASDNGECLITVNNDWCKYYACVFDGVDGVRLDRTDFSDESMLEYGRRLAQLHNLSEHFKPNVRKWTHEDVLEWIRQVLKEYNAPEAAVRFELELRKGLEGLPKDSHCYGLVHYDFEPDNVFYVKEQNRCNVIDFDDGMYLWYAADIEQALPEIEDCIEGERAEKAKQLFMQGYRELRDFDEAQEASLSLMRNFVDLYCYARLIRSLSSVIADEPDWMCELRVKLTNKIRRLENYFSACIK